MKIFELLEVDEPTKRLRTSLNKITQLLFRTGSDWVKDKKRSNDAIFLGVVNTESVIEDQKGKKIKLTFDNSTDSGEFELNSLSPLMIEKRSRLDLEISKLFITYQINSSKKTNYISRDGKMVLREIHVGTELGPNTVKFMNDVIELISSKTSRVD